MNKTEKFINWLINNDYEGLQNIYNGIYDIYRDIDFALVYEKIKDIHNPSVYGTLGIIYHGGCGGVKTDHTKACEYTLLAMEMGYPYSDFSRATPECVSIYFMKRCNELNDKIQHLEQKIIDLEYAPGGPVYMECKASFESQDYSSFVDK